MYLLSLLTDGLLMSVLSIIIVFVILYLLTLSVSLIKEKKSTLEPVTLEKSPILSIEDIKDEDMMVAVLTASIDYRNECKSDVRLISVKEITK